MRTCVLPTTHATHATHATPLAYRTVGMYRVSLRMKMGDDGSSAV